VLISVEELALAEVQENVAHVEGFVAESEGPSDITATPWGYV
jgi:hypothetical protein